MTDHYVYRYLRQQAKLPQMELNTYLEIEAAIDTIKGDEKASIRRQREMLFQQALCLWSGIKAKAFKMATIVWE